MALLPIVGIHNVYSLYLMVIRNDVSVVTALPSGYSNFLSIIEVKAVYHVYNLYRSKINNLENILK